MNSTVRMTLPVPALSALAAVADTRGMTPDALAAEYVEAAAFREYEAAGRICYELRRVGLTWKQVADERGYPKSSFGCQLARVYALTHRLPWPVGVDHRGSGRAHVSP